MNAMFLKASGVLIAAATPSWNLSIWVWMYICHVSDVHLPSLRMVESLKSISFKAIAPPARSEWEPTRSGSNPLMCRPIFCTERRVAVTMDVLVIEHHLSLLNTSQIRLSSEPPCARTCATLLASAATAPSGPVDSW